MKNDTASLIALEERYIHLPSFHGNSLGNQVEAVPCGEVKSIQLKLPRLLSSVTFNEKGKFHRSSYKKHGFEHKELNCNLHIVCDFSDKSCEIYI